MIIYFTGTGNSLVVARKIAAKTGDAIIAMHDAVERDLSCEKQIGLVFPTYMLDAPPAVRDLIPKLKLPKNAYVYIIITCGAQTNNAVWRARQLLREKGIEVAYCNKVRFPDTAGLAYRRNPNQQLWKLERYASRIDEIAEDIVSQRHAMNYAGIDLLGCLVSTKNISKKLYSGFIPKVNAEKCVGCGICEKICPQGNIQICNQKAVVGDRCTMCLGCVHFCSHQALELGGKPTDKSMQYHHPDIQVKDLYRR